MNRTLKFRVWDEKARCWVKGLMVYAENIMSQGKIFTQFTGLLDGNGKEIYEGDIINKRVYDGWDDEIGFLVKYQVLWSNVTASWAGYTNKMLDLMDTLAGVKLAEQKDSDLEIVGNIFENPELLK